MPVMQTVSSPCSRKVPSTISGDQPQSVTTDNGDHGTLCSHDDAMKSRRSKLGTGGSQVGHRFMRWATMLTTGGKVTDTRIDHAQQSRRNGNNAKNRVTAGTDQPSDEGSRRSRGHDSGNGRISASTTGNLFVTSPQGKRSQSSLRKEINGCVRFSSPSGPAGVDAMGSVDERSRGRARGCRALLRGDKFVMGCLVHRVIQLIKMAAALAALAIAGLGALLVGCCLYVTVRPWSRAMYRRLLCSQLAAPLVESAALLLPRTRVRITGDSDMLDGLCPCVIVSNTLPGYACLGLDWWAILMVVRAVGLHGYTKVLVSEQLNNTPMLGWILRMLEFPGLGECYQTDRDRVKQCLASFAWDYTLAGSSGIPYVFLHFPEGDTLNRETLEKSLEFARRERRPELMRVLLPHTTALSACLDGLSPAKPVVYDISLATAGYTGEVPCGKPPSHWTILRALASGRAWSRRGAPSTKLPHSGHRSNDQDSRHGCGTSATIMSSGGDKDSACNEPSCLCYTSGTTSTGSAAASRALGFTCGSSDLEGKSGASGGGTTGVARPLPIRGSGRKVAAEWTERFGEMDMQPNGVTWSGTNGNRTAATWGRICEDIHVRIRRYSLEEVIGNTSWLDERWAEKERLLGYFARHQGFPSDGRGFPARRTLDTRGAHFKGSAVAFIRLSAVVLLVPLLSIAAIPLLIVFGLIALMSRAILALIQSVTRFVFPRSFERRVWWRATREDDGEEGGNGCGTDYTLTPSWGGPSTPLNTPEPGAGGTIPYLRQVAKRGSGVVSGYEFPSK